MNCILQQIIEIKQRIHVILKYRLYIHPKNKFILIITYFFHRLGRIQKVEELSKSALNELVIGK